MKDISHAAAMASVFKEDPEYFEFYLNQIIADKDFDELLRLCKQLDVNLAFVIINAFKEQS